MVLPPVLAANGSAPGATSGIPDPEPEARRLRLKHHWTRESLDVVYRIGGDYQPEAMAAIDHFMRDWRCDKKIAMDPRLIDRLYDIQQTIGEGRTIRVISGYRSEGYNASLLAAGHAVDPESEHILGRAADIFAPGLKAEKLHEAAESQPQGGVGFYPFSGPRFVHVDTGPDRRWREMDPGVRRRLGIPRPRLKPLKIDCSLTMAVVMRQIAPMDALAALPPGAAHSPRGRCDDGGGLPPLDLLISLAEPDARYQGSGMAHAAAGAGETEPERRR
jgi:uncharacterized protein YcbK (DUF882 family)